MKTLLAAVAAFALLVSAAPASACEGCKNCPMHAQVDKKDAVCNCGKEPSKECKCGDKCTCGGHKHGQPEEKKDEGKKES
ncbi:MAG: hypothetical protein QM767_07730 [Anaeromyxobacter sp.]